MLKKKTDIHFMEVRRWAYIGSLALMLLSVVVLATRGLNFGLDFTGGTVTFDSGLLNAKNVIGGGTNTSGPVSLAAAPGGAVGNMIRIIRTRDDDLSGSGGLGNADEASVLSMDLVTADGTLIPEPSATLFGLLGLIKLPMHHHPIFASDRFEAASDDKFFISIEAGDQKFDLVRTKALLEATSPTYLELVEEEVQ